MDEKPGMFESLGEALKVLGPVAVAAIALAYVVVKSL